MSFTLVALTALLSGDSSSQVQGLALKDNVMDVIQFGTDEVFDALMTMAQDGVIRIPITKQETGYMSQTHSKTTSHDSDEDSSDDKKAVATSLERTNIKVREPMTNVSNKSYIGELWIGSPPQRVRAIFDTGSANPWILSKEAVDPDDTVFSPYDQTKSETYEEPSDDEKQWVDIGFGSGDITGYFVNDQVIMGSPTDSENQLVLKDWTFGMVVENSVFSEKFDALIGMAYPQFAEPGVTPLFDGLMESGQLAQNIHSWYLSYNPDEESEILMGAVNPDRFEGELEWHPVVHQLFWSLKLDDILIDGESTGYCNQEGRNCHVCPDSGTSLATFPQKHYDHFMKEYGDEVDCESGQELNFPDITYIINGIHYNLPSHHWVRRTIDEDNPKGGTCKSMLGDLDVDRKESGLTDLHILGDTFMQLFYTVHDRDNDRVGFAPAIHNSPEVLIQQNTDSRTAAVHTIDTSASDE